MDEPAALGLGPPGRLDPQAERLELALRAMSELVVREGRKEEAVAGQFRELDGGHRATSGRQLGEAACLDDLPGARHVLDVRELDPLDVADDGGPHRAPPRPRLARIPRLRDTSTAGR